MKLIFCHKCGDVVCLIKEEPRFCKCRESVGQYINNLDAWYEGKHAVPLGFNNFSLINALGKQPKDGMGERFEAFVIPKVCPTFDIKFKPEDSTVTPKVCKKPGPKKKVKANE